MKIQILLFTLLIASSSLAQNQPSDEQLSQFLVGTWVCEQRNQIGYHSEISLRSNGQFLLRISPIGYQSGMWTVRDGVIFYHITDWYPRSAKGYNDTVIILQQPPDYSIRVHVLDQDRVQGEDGTVSDRR